MSLYQVCPSCSSNKLGQVQKDYEEQQEKIKNNVKLSDKEKEEAMQKVAKGYGLKYCCNSRLICYTSLERTIKINLKSAP